MLELVGDGAFVIVGERVGNRWIGSKPLHPLPSVDVYDVCVVEPTCIVPVVSLYEKRSF